MVVFLLPSELPLFEVGFPIETVVVDEFKRLSWCCCLGYIITTLVKREEG
jgi:hypothetical protein